MMVWRPYMLSLFILIFSKKKKIYFHAYPTQRKNEKKERRKTYVDRYLWLTDWTNQPFEHLWMYVEPYCVRYAFPVLTLNIFFSKSTVCVDLTTTTTQKNSFTNAICCCMHWRLKFVLTAQHSSGKKRKNKIYKCKKTSLCLRIKDRYIWKVVAYEFHFVYIFSVF